MGKGEKSSTSYEEMYGDSLDIDGVDFENVNPFMEEEDSRFDNNEDDEAVEEVPEGIASPGRRAEKAEKKRKKQQKKSKSKKSSKKKQSGLADVLEDHELIHTQSSLGMFESVDEDDVDDLMKKKNSGFLGALRNSLGGLGGGAMSLTILVVLLAPAIGLTMSGVPYVVKHFAFVPFYLYFLMSLPVFIGWAFAMGLRTFGPLNGYPFRVGALSIFPWIKDWKLHVRVVVQDAAFGNPPGFPFKDFLQCERLDLEGSIAFSEMKNLLTLKKIPTPLKNVPDFERFIHIDFNHVEVQNAMVNFQLMDGQFNINTFTRILADGEAKAVWKKDPFPNQLCIKVLRAKNLLPHRLKKSCDPYVVVRCRRQEAKTYTQTKTLNPMWNEEVVLHVEDSSTVIEVAVYDRDAPEGNQAFLIGHWAMTAKYLITDPTFCWHQEKNFTTYTKKNKKEGGVGFEGWVPLATRAWKKMGACGSLQLEVLWKNVPEDMIQNRYVPARRYTALEQLQLQSAEDQLRFGDFARFKSWLQHEPFCYDIKRFTVRGTRFYLQDLFRGVKGKPETLVRANASLDGANAIKLPFLEMRKQFRPKHGDMGITSYDVFIGFFIGLISSAARSGRVGHALAQIASGGMFNVGYKFRSLLMGKLDTAMVPIRGHQVKGVATLARSGFHVLHQQVTQNRRNKKQFKSPVEAEDSDFLLDKVDLYGHLDRCAVKITDENVSPSDMAQLAKRKGNFKTKYFEVKGTTLFFRKHKKVPKDVTYNLTYKLSLDHVFQAVHVESANELLLYVQDENHIVRLRDCSNEDGKEVDKKGANKLKKWIKLVKEYEIPFEEY